MLATLPIPTNARIGYPILQRSGQAGRISCGILRMRKYANLFFLCKGEWSNTDIWIIMQADAERRKNLEVLRERRKRKILENASLRMEKLKGHSKQ